jgi:hypothetical protein
MICYLQNELNIREKKSRWCNGNLSPLRKLTATYCKIEKGECRAKREQAIALAKIFKVNSNDFLTLWIADKIIEVVKEKKELAGEALKVVLKKKNE